MFLLMIAYADNKYKEQIREERKRNPLISLSIKQFALHKKMVGSVISIGNPGALITVLPSVSNIILNNFIGIYSFDAVAPYFLAACCLLGTNLAGVFFPDASRIHQAVYPGSEA